jgi:CBS domain-containing protein
MNMQDIMTEPLTIDKSEKLSYALDTMEKFSTRRLLVMHNNSIHGIVTMRTITRELGTRKKSNLPASAIHVATATNDNYNKVLPDMPVTDGVILMNKNNGILLIIDNDDVVGWVTPQQVIENYPFGNSYAGEIMRQPITIGPGERVIHARRIMLDNDIGRLPVIENGELVGIITEHDIATGLRAFRDLVSGNQQDSRIKNLLVSLMLEKNLGGVPVVNLEDELVGLVTRRSLLDIIANKT